MKTQVQEIVDKLKNLTWDLEASPKAIQGLKLIIEAAELQSSWGKYMHQAIIDALISTEAEVENEWYIEVRLCKKE